MSTRKRSHRSRSVDPVIWSPRTFDEPASHSKRLSTGNHRFSDVVLSKGHEIEDEIILEFTASPNQKKNSQESLSEMHERSKVPKEESPVHVKLSNEAKIKGSSWKQLSTTKHGSMEASKFSDKQNCEDKAKNERKSSRNSSKWEYETCIKDMPKSSSHRWSPKKANESHNSEKMNTSLHWSSTQLFDENKTKDAKKSSGSGWNSWDCKEADASITHKSSSTKWDPWPSDDIRTDSLRNSVKWDSKIDINDAKTFSNPKSVSRNSMETKADQSRMNDPHKSSSSKQRLWEDENKNKDAPKSSSSRWTFWGRKKDDTNITQKSSTKWNPWPSDDIKDDSSRNNVNASITHKSSSMKWDPWPSDDIKDDSSRNNVKWHSEISVKDGKRYYNPKLESMNSKETKTDRRYIDDSHTQSSSKWGHKTIDRDVKKSSRQKGDSWVFKKINSNLSRISQSSARRNMNSSLNDSKWVTETNAVDAVKSSGPEWNSWDSEKSKSDSSWYVSKWISEFHSKDSNMSSRQKLSSWDSKESRLKSTLDDTKHGTETNARDALTFSVPKLDSSNYNEPKINSKSDSSWDRFIVKLNPKDADRSSSLGWGSWDTNETKIKATLPRTDRSNSSRKQGCSKVTIDYWNSQKDNTSSWNDSEWRRETNTKSTPKWGKSLIDERAAHSARLSLNDDRHFDEATTKKRTSSGANSKNHILSTSASVFKESYIGTGSKQSSCRERIDEITGSTLTQNDLKWGSWNDIKDSKIHNVSSWSGPKWDDRTAKNEGTGECNKDESNGAIPLNRPKQSGDDTDNHSCLPDNTLKTSEIRNGYAMNNEMSASCEAFQNNTLSGTHVSNNEPFGHDQHDMKFFGHHSDCYVIKHTEDDKVKENVENKKLPPYESQKQNFDADLHSKAKNVTHCTAKPVTLDVHHIKNKGAMEASNIWVQSSSATGTGNSNQSAEACGIKIVEGKKEDKGILMLKSAVADFVKDILKPYWKRGHLTREDHKTIVRKVVCKVIGSLPENIIPVSEKYVEDYMSYNRIQLTNLVAAYLDNLQTQNGKRMERTTTEPVADNHGKRC